MKHYADQRRTKRHFDVGDEVYLKLQPCRQTFLALRKNLKLTAKFYGPYKVTRRIGLVAYILNLPEHSKLHPIVHVSLLKKKLGNRNFTSIEPHEMTEDG
ncbi:hypothetical protein HRI_001248500 [Hibiscus trionum]|uniref:Tf2-1-like SH3-like domain-containing protein n=1 Tax=Hibiscus trionum TaxID=183268 RepID=A0A9W7HF28_HIBTR|nr:hypothetical protein HRI_001248500 [Hibiscus trionum]